MLNKSSIRAIAAAAIALATSGAFAASDGATLTVTATVGAKCKVTTTAMAFGSLDPTVGGDAPATATVSYKCTNGTKVNSFGVNSVLSGATGTTGVMDGSGTAAGEQISYSITWDDPLAFTGKGLGATAEARTLTLNGKILNTEYVDKKPGSYSGTIGLAVNY